MYWWLWMLLGFALLVTELVAPGTFVALFFGLAALLVGALVGAGVVEIVWLQWILFSVVAVTTLFVLRKPLQARLNVGKHATPVDAMTGEEAVVTEPVPAGGSGRVELRGSTWTARTRDGSPLALGQRCQVEAVDGLTVFVKPN